MKEIQLTQGKVALVDDEDYEWLSQWRWIARKQSGSDFYYACRTQRTSIDGERKVLVFWMHRVLLGLQYRDGLHGDHINHNTLDNRRCNLRVATASQNQGNSLKHKPKSSRYKGVHWSKAYQKWVATISLHGKQKFIGYCGREEDAAALYNAAAVEAFGEFAALNTIPTEIAA